MQYTVDIFVCVCVCMYVCGGMGACMQAFVCVCVLCVHCKMFNMHVLYKMHVQ